jgi:hypothetical protein
MHAAAHLLFMSSPDGSMARACCAAMRAIKLPPAITGLKQTPTYRFGIAKGLQQWVGLQHLLLH